MLASGTSEEGGFTACDAEDCCITEELLPPFLACGTFFASEAGFFA